MTTVLLAVIGATIALAGLWTALARTRAAAADRDAATATVSLFSALGEYESHLVDDPQYFLSYVDRYERARVCTGTTPPRIVEPGEAWPVECGAFWTYVDPQPGAPDRPEPARIVVIPPGASRPYLTIQAVASSGSVTMARERTYSLSSASSKTVYAEEDIRLDELVRDPELGLTVSGDIYTGGKLFLSANSSVDLDDALLLAEEGFYPPGAVSSTETLRWFCAEMPDGTALPDDLDSAPDPCPIPDAGLEDIRLIEPAPLRAVGLGDDITRLREVGCGPINPENAASNPIGHPNKTFHLCITPGASLYDINGTLRVVQPWATSFLLRFSVANPDTNPHQIVSVWTADTGPSFVHDCVIACSLPSLAAQEVAQGTHMGSPRFWAAPRDANKNGVWGEVGERGIHVGDFFLPVSGVIFVDGDTHVGLCGNDFTVEAGACETQVGANPAGVVGSVTVLAGTRTHPADIYISGPLEIYLQDGQTMATASGRLGLVATRHLFIPYWARTPGEGGDLRIDASLLAMGIGADYDAGRFRGAFSSLPATVHVGYEGSEDNQGGTLSINGSVAGPAVDLSTNQFRQVILSQDPRLLADSPPYFPSFMTRWDLRTINDISPADLCGSLDCASWITD